MADLVYAQTGDRIWWTWDAKTSLSQSQLFTISEIDLCLNPTFKKPVSGQEKETYQHLDKESLKVCTKVGLATTHFTTIGVYHYRVDGAPESMNTCSVIVNPGSKNNTIHITDNDFEPKVITVRPNDQVWWVWQSGKKQQNVIQVSHQGAIIDKGFSSGMLRDAPSAFTYQFITPGVFYYNSISLPKIFGAIVVLTQPHVHEVQVSSAEIKPDPVTIKQNDIVCWIFKTPPVRVKDAYISSDIKSGTVDRFTRVDLASETPGAKLYYTIDGSPAELHIDSLKAYDPEKGVILRNSGLAFIRAVAVKEGRMQSHIFTSRRFFVQGDAEDGKSMPSASRRVPPVEQKGTASAKAWEWWDCIPTIKACFTDPGTLEVFWDPPEKPLIDLIRGYQVFDTEPYKPGSVHFFCYDDFDSTGSGRHVIHESTLFILKVITPSELGYRFDIPDTYKGNFRLFFG